MSAPRWPVATLSPTARLRALAAALPGAVLAERHIDAPFERVWGFIADLERSVPAFDRGVAALRITERDGDRLRFVATTGWRRLTVRTRFEAELTEGWCWMVSRPRAYVVGMAATPEGGGTRFAHLEGIAVPAPGAARHLLWPVHAAGRWWGRRHVPEDLDGIERAARG